MSRSNLFILQQSHVTPNENSAWNAQRASTRVKTEVQSVPSVLWEHTIRKKAKNPAHLVIMDTQLRTLVQ